MNLSGYPALKSSGVPWLGDVAVDWDVQPLKYLVITRVTDGPHATPDIFSEGIPFVSAEAINHGRINFDKIRGHITEEDHKSFSKKYKPQRGDIYLVKSGATTGRIAIVETDAEFNIWSPLAAIRCDPTIVTPYFLYFYMHSREFQTGIELSWSFGTQQNIGMGVIENLDVPLPSLSEQKQIAAFLNWKTGQIDALIARKQALLEKLKEKRIAVITQAVTKGFNPAAPMRDSGIPCLGQVPQHWAVKRLKFCVSKVGSGVTPKGGAEAYELSGIPLFRSQNIHFDGLRLDDIVFISEETHSDMSNSQVASGDVLLNITGASIGRCYYVPENFGEGNVNQHVTIIRPEAEMLTRFLHLVICSDVGQTQIDLEQSGSGREGLTFFAIKNFVVALPDLSEQAEIVRKVASQLSRVDALQLKVESAIAKLTEYRTALITAATTGKIDVRNVKAPT